MRYLLDTSTWIIYLKDLNTRVRGQLERTPVGEIATTSVVWAEVLHGARKYGNPARRQARVEQVLGPYAELPFSRAAARHYADIRDHLERIGQTIGVNDLLIASMARAHGLTVVTHNGDEFQRVPGLNVEDWSV